MTTIEVNGRTVEAREDEFLLAALRRAGVRVPTLCHCEGLPPTGQVDNAQPATAQATSTGGGEVNSTLVRPAVN